jgi:hypothetical protein
MAEERPYSLLIRLGAILVPILAGILVWSYYHPPVSLLSPRAPSVIPAPLAATAPKASESADEPTDPISGPAAVGASAPVPAVAPENVRPDPGTFRTIATGKQTSSGAPRAPPPASTSGPLATNPATPPTAPQSAASGRERTKTRDARKQEPAPAHSTIQKLDKEIDRKLSICSGC